MTRGRTPLPTAIKKIKGNPGKRKLNKKEPKPNIEIPECPSHITGLAKQEWDRVTVHLQKMGVISQIDRAVLSAYCTAYKDYVEAEQKIKKEGEVIFYDSGSAAQNPRVGIKNKAMEKLIRIAAEFGMTPSSRSRLEVDSLPGDEDEMKKLLLGGKRKSKKQ